MKPYMPNGPAREDDAVYRAAARAEAEFWSSPTTLLIADALATAPLGPSKRHHNRRLAGSETRYWYERIAEHGPYRRGLVLGSGSTIEETAILQQNPGVHLTFCDIDEQGLAKRQALFAERFPGCVTVQPMDLNFVELERNAYDLIISADTLHHVVNLEHVAEQINHALTQEGWFFLHDFTGASGFRFPMEQKQIFEAVYSRERARRPEAQLPLPEWKDVDNYETSPFEAVRSADIVAVLAGALREVFRCHAGTIFAMPMFCDILREFTPPKPLPAQARFGRKKRQPQAAEAPPIMWELLLSAEFFRELSLIDDIVTDAGLFSPISTVAIYRKRTWPLPL
jgi:SAM-dependent methyltransferase